MSLYYCISFDRTMRDGSIYRHLFAEKNGTHANQAIAVLESDNTVFNIKLNYEDLAEFSPVIHLGIGFTHKKHENGYPMCNWSLALSERGWQNFIATDAEGNVIEESCIDPRDDEDFISERKLVSRNGNVFYE